ncbi:MAG: efflux RND transporter periplasmic adaptor subunit, partial [Proteobacteria bacterium]|nr:efflux RND transporter periplasmic adaptor subunit [Pseudomonadota bacterium]
MVAILLGAGAAFYVFGWPLVVPADGHQPTANARGGNRAAEVVVRTVELRPERTRLKAVGTARAVRSVTLYAAAAGEVAAVRIAPNAKVKKNDVLLELDSRNEALAVELARVRVKSARQLLSRYERMAKGVAVSRSSLLDARNALEEVAIALRQAEVALSDRKVVASFDGFVGVTEIDVGDRIGTGDAITTLDDRRALLVAFDIPEIFLGLIKIDHPVQVAAWNAQDNPIDGAIVDLGSRIDAASRSFVARARIANGGDRYRPGM